jgi:hypothetical protein
VFLVFTFEAIVFVCWSALVVVHHQTTAHLQERPEAECYTLQLPDTLGLILQPVRESTLHTVLSARTLLALSAFGRIGALAESNINVALQASFAPAPYLVELL